MNTKANLKFLFLWPIAMVVGLIAQDFFIILFGNFVRSEFYYFIILFISGFVIGILQWLFIRKKLLKARWWILSMPIALIMGMMALLLTRFILLDNLIAPFYTNDIGLPWYFIDIIKWFAIGLTAGILQWLILRKQVKYALIWPVVSTIGYTIGGTYMEYINADVFGFGMGYLFGGLIIGIATGVALCILLNISKKMA